MLAGALGKPSPAWAAARPGNPQNQNAKKVISCLPLLPTSARRLNVGIWTKRRRGRFPPQQTIASVLERGRAPLDIREHGFGLVGRAQDDGLQLRLEGQRLRVGHLPGPVAERLHAAHGIG